VVIGNMVTQIKLLSLLQKFMQIRSQTQSFIKQQSLIIFLKSTMVVIQNSSSILCLWTSFYCSPFKYSYFATNISEDSTFSW